MRNWSAERIAQAAGAELVRDAPGSPTSAVINSREAKPGQLFVGLIGDNVDGGEFASDARRQGAWGSLVSPGHEVSGDGALLVARDPLRAMQRLATAYRRDLGAKVIAITGSTGKTSTKDALAALLATERRVSATPENLNTEIGVPLAILMADPGTEAMVLEMAMRGPGQISELALIAEPDVAVITNIGPVHLELLGSIEAIAAAKAELIDELDAGATAVIPRDDGHLELFLRDDIDIVRFADEPQTDELTVTVGGERLSHHMLLNVNAAKAAAAAIGVRPRGTVDVRLSARRGQRTILATGTVVIDDCYNANPMSMRAALDDLALSAHGRSVAVLGDMLELGPDEVRFHEEIGEHARAKGVDVLVTVGPLAEHMKGDHAVATADEAAKLMPSLLQNRDTVLVKASRGVGLEAVCTALTEPNP
jgi:UDP-N-acetylmuramoyl-tripeptide--D-alanyl-D-alanine ligase